jgi:glycosyltransferase involved in cell wall biosynthesis
MSETSSSDLGAPHLWSVLILSRHAPQAASSRLRTYQYIPYLRAAGAEISVAPFFDAAYLQQLYAENSRRRYVEVGKAYIRRLRALFGVRRYSVVWVEKELFPFLPASFEAFLRLMRVPYVVDYDDATFHTYDHHRRSLVRILLSNKLDPLLRGAQTVAVGNSYLEAYVSAHGARAVVRIPTTVDIQRYSVRPAPSDQELRIGWIGTPKTVKYLELLFAPLRKVARKRRLRLVTIGAPSLGDIGVPVEQHDWSSETEAQLLSSLHLGVMPLPDEPWERGKCGYKLIQYMACGRPVIASPVGVNTDIVTPQVGFLASTDEEWVTSIEALANDRNLRDLIGVSGRQRVEQEYTVQMIAPRIVKLLRQAAKIDA